MSSDSSQTIWKSLRRWWCDAARQGGPANAPFLLVRKLWSFLRESTPEQHRQRYGDMECDWEHRVNTTSGTVG